jgi:hypothetical protein
VEFGSFPFLKENKTKSTGEVLKRELDAAILRGNKTEAARMARMLASTARPETLLVKLSTENDLRMLMSIVRTFGNPKWIANSPHFDDEVALKRIALSLPLRPLEYVGKSLLVHFVAVIKNALEGFTVTLKDILSDMITPTERRIAANVIYTGKWVRNFALILPTGKR